MIGGEYWCSGGCVVGCGEGGGGGGGVNCGE